MEILIGRLLVYVSCLVLSAVPLYFIFHHVYKDGAFGRLGLALIAFFSTGLFSEGVFGDGDYDTMRRLMVGLIVAFAIFLSWHLMRWHSRIVKAPDRAPCGRVREIGCPYKVEPR